MKSKIFVVVIFGLPLTTLLAQPPNFSHAVLSQNQITRQTFLTLSDCPSLHFVDSLNTAMTKPERSVAKAAFFSAVIPGAGELYNKSFLKGLAFLGIEVGSWVVYGVYTKRGNEKEDEFEQYADAHWSEKEYWDFIYDECLADPNGSGYNCDRKNLISLRRWERDHFSHFLPDEKNQTYYENVGKYNQFNIGWDDTQSGGHDARDSEHREIYTRMRRDANDQFKTATIGATVVLFNHIVSAIDAGITTYRYNRRAEASMGMKMQRYDRELVPALSLQMRW
jgi:hypothetical protein